MSNGHNLEHHGVTRPIRTDVDTPRLSWSGHQRLR